MRLNLALQNSVTTTASACLELIAGVPRGFFLMEMDISVTAATTSEFGLGVPAARGVTPTLQTFVGPGDPNAYYARAATAWGTPPTVPTKFQRRGICQNVIGSTIIWQFDDFKSDKPNGLWVGPNTTLVLWNLGTVGVCDISMIIEEKWANQQ